MPLFPVRPYGNERNPKRALLPWVHQISGNPAIYPTVNVSPHEKMFEEDRKFISDHFGIIFDLENKQGELQANWQQTPKKDLVRLINEKLIEIQHLKSELKYRDCEKAELKGNLEQAKQDLLASLELHKSNERSLQKLAEIEAKLNKS